MALLVFAQSGESPTTDQLVSSRIQDRLTKHFDFDEREIGNYESMPAGWRQLNAVRYPRFLEPKFDMKVGHDAPPSFRLALIGGSLACFYYANDISVHPDCDYEISAWIKPAGLEHARSFVRAYFLDHAMNKINESERRSTDVRGPGQDEPWSFVKITLPAGFERARGIGLSVHVEQARRTPADPENPRPINYHDVRAAAWFDDIRVIRRPGATLQVSAEGNVFDVDAEVACRAGVTDLDGRGLDARLELFDAAGEAKESRVIPVGSLDAPAEVYRFANLQPGLYRLRLVVESEGKELLRREESFVRLGDLPAVRQSIDAGFGVIADPTAPAHGKTSARLTRLLGVQSAKIPLWREAMDDEDIVTGDKAADELIRSLRLAGVRVVGILDRPPPSLLETFGHPRHTVLDVLSTSPDRWRPYLSFLLARYGEEVNAWQIGRLTPDPAIDGENLAAALTHLKAELKPLVGSPRIVVPREITTQIDAFPVKPDVFSVTAPGHFASDHLVEQLEARPDKTNPSMWITLEDLDPSRFDRIARLSEIARRLVLARVAGAEEVFVAQPWWIDGSDSERVTIDESYVALRTVATLLGGLRPVTRVWLGPGATGWLFAGSGGEHGVLVAWSDGERVASRTTTTDAVPDSRHFDLWAREKCPEGRRDGRELALDVTPSFLVPVDSARVRTMATFAVEPAMVKVQIEPNRATLRLTNHFASRLTGVLKILPPPSWEVTPREVAIDIPPGTRKDIDLSIRIPSNYPIGPNTIVGRIAAEGLESEYIHFRAPVEVVCPGLDVSVMARADKGGLKIIQRLTNRSGRPLDLRSNLIYASDRRMSRLIRSLPDGQSTLREFTIDDSALTRGNPIRICTESISGDLKCNQLVTID